MAGDQYVWYGPKMLPTIENVLESFRELYRALTDAVLVTCRCAIAPFFSTLQPAIITDRMKSPCLETNSYVWN